MFSNGMPSSRKWFRLFLTLRVLYASQWPSRNSRISQSIFPVLVCFYVCSYMGRYRDSCHSMNEESKGQLLRESILIFLVVHQYVGGKYVKMYVCLWLVLVGNAMNRGWGSVSLVVSYTLCTLADLWTSGWSCCPCAASHCSSDVPHCI